MINRYGEIPAVLQIDEEPDDPLSIQWWFDLNIEKSAFEDLLKNHENILPPFETYDGILNFGNYDEHHLSIPFNDENRVEEVSCRLDLRTLTDDIISLVIDIALKYDCLFMDIKGNIFNPQLKEVFNIIRSSNANRFVNNPEKFLNDLHNGLVKPE